MSYTAALFLLSRYQFVRIQVDSPNSVLMWHNVGTINLHDMLRQQH